MKADDRTVDGELEGAAIAGERHLDDINEEPHEELPEDALVVRPGMSPVYWGKAPQGRREAALAAMIRSKALGTTNSKISQEVLDRFGVRIHPRYVSTVLQKHQREVFEARDNMDPREVPGSWPLVRLVRLEKIYHAQLATGRLTEAAQTLQQMRSESSHLTPHKESAQDTVVLEVFRMSMRMTKEERAAVLKRLPDPEGAPASPAAAILALPKGAIDITPKEG